MRIRIIKQTRGQLPLESIRSDKLTALLGIDLKQVFLFDSKQPPALLKREVGCSATLVELDRWLVPFRHYEVHAAAAGFNCRLGKRWRPR